MTASTVSAAMLGPDREALLLPMSGGRRGHRLVIRHRPPTGVPPRGTVVYVHPFGDEMNKSRRMAALQSRALAAAGNVVVQIDLLGCGDSSGEFEDSTWGDWVEDIVETSRWALHEHEAPLTLWGLRAGCFIAAAAAVRLDRPTSLLCWQPMASGRIALQQFLRLRLASEMRDGQDKALLPALRDRLARGETIDVAGYRLPPALAAGLESAVLEPAGRIDRLVWLEVFASDAAALSPVSAATVERWRTAGRAVDAEVVRGPAFWLSVEIEEAPALIDATLAAMDSRAA